MTTSFEEKIQNPWRPAENILLVSPAINENLTVSLIVAIETSMFFFYEKVLWQLCDHLHLIYLATFLDLFRLSFWTSIRSLYMETRKNRPELCIWDKIWNQPCYCWRHRRPYKQWIQWRLLVKGREIHELNLIPEGRLITLRLCSDSEILDYCSELRNYN